MPTIEYNNKNYTSTKQNFGARVDECPTHKVEDSIMSDVSGNFRPDDYEVADGSHYISIVLEKEEKIWLKHDPLYQLCFRHHLTIVSISLCF